ncbi:FAD-dependent oxidoreductase [Novosphingobium album (ex Hu et al. 2023)]|uniref:D-amino-acid oxidase n=1 Tax=Novosphingobium album (ex Hu et al. 2023) TaxID=2930093 RepID=A0ABT0B2X3_9SPHN|nr:FAD-dependent oxidoreductase [Novosphingobium album (ex Hu et al. 2023)]MCJ2179390.1 FAD-binding oxidoreductase [Novosphingobium album (ex Hu et al. 2023)]
MLDRRSLIVGGSLAALAGPTVLRAQTGRFALPEPLIPVDARRDRMYRVTVCLRPFRAAGPRIEAERISGKTVVHHYGHGGSGWSLSWGSAQQAVPLAIATGARDIAVIGAGAIGLTSAITAQRMGAKVTIYTKERFPQIRSGYATGSWTPSSRIGMEDQVAPGFGDWWEKVARASYAMHQSYLGVAGSPVEWTPRWFLSDEPPGPHKPSTPDGRPRFLELDHVTGDLVPDMQNVAPEDNPFAIPYARRNTQMTFNVAQYCRQLEAEFEASGGRFVHAELESVKDLRHIRETTILNCTGYAARALFGDESIVPVRGQIAWLLPQPGVNYGVFYNHLYVLARRDGIVVQALGENDYFGFDDPDETPDMAAAVAAIDQAGMMFRPKSI